MSTLAFRLATLDDTAAVVALVNGAYRGDDGRHGWTSEHELLTGVRIDDAGFRALLDRPASVVLLALRDGAPVGCVHLQRRDVDGECGLGMLSVRVDAQDGGVGRALLAAAEPYARDELGANMLVLHAISVRDELLAWYERRGYRRTGSLVPFKPGVDARFLRGPLFFERLEKKIA